MSSRQDDSQRDGKDAESLKRKPCDSPASHDRDDKAEGNPAVETYFSEEELEQEFADRYTESDPEYRSLSERPSRPPVITPW